MGLTTWVYWASRGFRVFRVGKSPFYFRGHLGGIRISSLDNKTVCLNFSNLRY
jgi:hypothetical protein